MIVGGVRAGQRECMILPKVCAYLYIYIFVQPRGPRLKNGVVARPHPQGGVSEYCRGRFIKPSLGSRCWGLEIATTTRTTTRSPTTTATTIIIIIIPTVSINTTGTNVYYLLQTAYYLRTQ